MNLQLNCRLMSGMKTKQNKQRVGFNTMKMEDGLRCDPCSCFYVDKRDYLKHMTQHHKTDQVPGYRKQRKKRKGGCSNCCEWCDCTGVHIDKDLLMQQSGSTKARKIFRMNIQSRWNMISKQLTDGNPKSTKIKTEPEDDGFEASSPCGLVKVEVKVENEDILVKEEASVGQS